VTSSGRPSVLRILYFTRNYPAFSQTYLEVERRYLESRHDTALIAFNAYNLQPRTHLSCHYVDRDRPGDWAEAARAFAPDVVHGYFLSHIEATWELARRLDRPFTMRLHSTDVMSLPERRLPRAVECINDALCLGALVFPFLRAGLERAGADPGKLVDAWPVLDYARFHDTGPNGDGVMGVGASVPKKDFGSFIRMAAEVPSRPFRLYALNYDADEMRRLEAVSRNLGAPAAFMAPVEHAEMPSEYKKHAWLLYTAMPGAPVGWPMAVLEAQASGVGVCVRRVRPDLEVFLGETGVLFDTYDEIRDVLAGPVPEDIRARGFENARKGDIENQIGVLERMWGLHESTRTAKAAATGGR
jgi:glycosyltransferase involved in cell wall biosynthesis